MRRNRQRLNVRPNSSEIQCPDRAMQPILGSSSELARLFSTIRQTLGKWPRRSATETGEEQTCSQNGLHLMSPCEFSGVCGAVGDQFQEQWPGKADYGFSELAYVAPQIFAQLGAEANCCHACGMSPQRFLVYLNHLHCAAYLGSPGPCITSALPGSFPHNLGNC